MCLKVANKNIKIQKLEYASPSLFFSLSLSNFPHTHARMSF